MSYLKQGLLNNYVVYSKILSHRVKECEGDELEEFKIAELIRETIFDMNILTREEVEHDINEYAKFAKSSELNRFLKICLRFVELTVSEPLKTVDNIILLGEEAKKLWHSDDECIVALVLDKVIDYTNGLE